MNREDFDAAISRGIALLDEKAIPDWYTAKQLRLTDLDMGDRGYCVCGQLYGEYFMGLIALKIDYPSEYGFDFTGDDEDSWSEPRTYAKLTQIWKQRIRQLRRERKGRH